MTITSPTDTLRQALTRTYEDSSGDVADLRRRGVVLLKAHLEAGRALILEGAALERNGLTTARALSRLTDEVVTALWDYTLTHVYRARNPTEGERLALLAVGGYGRGELAPFSDIDLLFLRVWKETSHSESVIEFILYSLWDLGLKVGHASRSLDETLKLARADHTILTAVLEFRPLAGDADLVARLKTRLEAEVIRPTVHEFVAAKLGERESRHARGGDARYVVEPNVKEGKGGLRDLQSLFWIAKALSGQAGSPSPDAPLDWGPLTPWLSEREQRGFMRAFEFLWRVRILLHLLSGRGEDRLSFDSQPEIARLMGYVDRFGEPNVERFMRRYFNVAREVGALTRVLCAKLDQAQKRPLALLGDMIQTGLMRFTRPDYPGLVLLNGRLSITTPDIFRSDPVLMLRLFAQADRLNLDIHPDAFAAVSRNLDLVTLSFRRSVDAARVFLDLLAGGRSSYRILSLMAESGLLGRYIPEFGHIVGRTQFNMYHAYTVDDHTLRAVNLIREIDQGLQKTEHPLASQLIRQLDDRETLYLAMLLHDTGKGNEAGQEIAGEAAARRASRRLGLSEWQVEQVAWLVRHHLVLSDFAQKRDVSDPQTVAAFARIVETPERLRLLLILTVADIRAVGPGVWNGWKGQLMRDLWAVTEAMFRGGRISEDADQLRYELQDKVAARRAGLLALHPADPFLGAWLQSVDAAYIDHFDDVTLMMHAHLARAAQVTGAAASAQIDLSRNATAFTVAARDRKGLFADLAKSIAKLGANVVGAAIYTSDLDLGLDVFFVQDVTGAPFGSKDVSALDRARLALEVAATKGVSGAPHMPALAARQAAFAIAPTVTFDSEARAGTTIVEVSGRDRPGLLADLAWCFDRFGLNLASAHIDCYGERAVDAFYVNSASGGLGPSEQSRLKEALLSALNAEPAGPARRPLSARASTAR